jgi:putative ABC transport system permease protein
VITQQEDDDARFQVAEALETRLSEVGLDVQSKMTAKELRASLEVLFAIVVTFLMSTSVLLAVVGGIGLMGTMGLNVLERIREIGVMRAIGASNDSVLQIFVVEGVLIGLLSWLIGTVLAIPTGKVLSNAVGMEVLRTPLTYTVPLSGVLTWLAIVIALAALASYLPARDAARLTVREVLSYER